MGTNSLPIDHRMKYQIVLLAVTLALLVTEAQAKKNKKDVRCKNRRGSVTEKTITLNAKETLKFETRGKKYNPDLSCVGEYMLGSCQQASISCPKFKVSNNNGIDECTDALIVGFNGDEKTYCGNEGPKNFKPDGDFTLSLSQIATRRRAKAGVWDAQYPVLMKTVAMMTVTTMVMMMAMMITMMMMTVEMRRKSAIVVSPLARRESLVVRRQKFRNTHGR